MKKALPVILTIIGGLLSNAFICAASIQMIVLMYQPEYVVMYAIAAAAPILVYTPALIVTVGNTADKSGVSRKKLCLCAQAPILALSLAYFIKALVTYDPQSDNVTFCGWHYVDPGLELHISICMLVTSVLTTAFVFITAAVVKRKCLMRKRLAVALLILGEATVLFGISLLNAMLTSSLYPLGIPAAIIVTAGTAFGIDKLCGIFEEKYGFYTSRFFLCAYVPSIAAALIFVIVVGCLAGAGFFKGCKGGMAETIVGFIWLITSVAAVVLGFIIHAISSNIGARKGE